MKLDRRLLAAMLAPGLALAVWLVAGGLLLRATLDDAARARLGAALAPLVASHGMLVLAWWLVAAGLAAWVVRRLYASHVVGVARLVDATRVLAGHATAADLVAPTPAVAELTAAINGLAAHRRTLAAHMGRLVDEASRNVAEERDQLGALMGELKQSVVVCNLDGRILLYNGQARALFRRLSPAPGGAAGAEFIGLGRSIHAVIDRALIDHALEGVRRGVARGEAASARFVTTTPAGHLIRVSLAPVRPGAADAGPSGYVLLLDDITDEYEAQSRRDRHLVDLTEASRASLASVQAALEMLDYPDLGLEERARFQAVVRAEIEAMVARLDAGAGLDAAPRWPLQDMLGADLVAAAAQRIAAAAGQVPATEVDPDLWLTVDSFPLIQALAFLAARLSAAGCGGGLTLRLARAGGRAHLDLAWIGEAGAEALADWQSEPIEIGGVRQPHSVRDVAERHGGEIWVARDAGNACFRILLPLASGGPEAEQAGARPEYYDFELFAAGEANGALDERPLAELAYTVFDTETTGLDPAGGDEIIQFGAVRIVNGKLLTAERFDQLVDPGRSIPEASIPFHGIRPEMVRDQPRIAAVLPAFHAFAHDTVLVGHNVAFDMRFLQLKEAATGVRFEQPVLDTLLLASIVHPNEPSHALEAIAARFGVTVSARHSAAGDALTTAQVFLKLLPLLREHQIVTLGQARTAAAQSYFARLRY